VYRLVKGFEWNSQGGVELYWKPSSVHMSKLWIIGFVESLRAVRQRG